MKVCLRCKEEKPFELFSKSKKSKDGYQIYCKACRSKDYYANREELLDRQKKNYWEKRDEKIAYRKRYYKENKDSILPKLKKYQEENPHIKRNSYFKRNYGITLDEYEALVEKQEKRCAVCGDSPDYNLVVDHNHNTGEIRGLLCQPCNQALGLLKDSPDVLQSAQNYLIDRGHYG